RGLGFSSTRSAFRTQSLTTRLLMGEPVLITDANRLPGNFQLFPRSGLAKTVSPSGRAERDEGSKVKPSLIAETRLEPTDLPNQLISRRSFAITLRRLHTERPTTGSSERTVNEISCIWIDFSVLQKCKNVKVTQQAFKTINFKATRFRTFETK
ncbi:hypothetical protein K0M31_015640, partial [Melipona bicolor]